MTSKLCAAAALSAFLMILFVVSVARYAEGSAPARRPTPTTVTFLNGRVSDISIRWTQKLATPPRRIKVMAAWT